MASQSFGGEVSRVSRAALKREAKRAAPHTHSASEVEGKRTKTLAADLVEQKPKSIPTFVREIAVGWIRQETTWYEDSSLSSSQYKPIDNKGKQVVNSSHLAKATKEYVKRFASCTEEEDAASNKFSGSPYLLVATNVKSTWSIPKKFAKFRFMLVPMDDESSALFITLMPGMVHATVDGSFSGVIGQYLRSNGLARYVAKAHSGGGTYQPHIRLFPVIPDPTGPHQDLDQDHGRTYSRVVVEFEFGNRNASALRAVGFAVLNNDYGALFVGVKIWKKSVAGVFGAAAVVWERLPATGTIAVRQAFDFGTKALTTQTKVAWSHAGATVLPPVPVGSWLRPLPIDAVAAVARPPIGQVPAPQQSWSLVLPKNLMFYRMPSSTVAGSPYIPIALPALQDCVIDLQEYQQMIDAILG